MSLPGGGKLAFCLVTEGGPEKKFFGRMHPSRGVLKIEQLDGKERKDVASLGGRSTCRPIPTFEIKDFTNH